MFMDYQVTRSKMAKLQLPIPSVSKTHSGVPSFVRSFPTKPLRSMALASLTPSATLEVVPGYRNHTTIGKFQGSNGSHSMDLAYQ